MYAVVTLIVAGGCSRGIDQAKYAGVYKAAQAMRGATAVGVTLMHYRELLGAFASEVAMANDSAKSDDEKQMVGMYAAALMNYKDVATLWAAKIDNRGAALPTMNPDVDALATKYRLEQSSAAPRTIDADASIQAIWGEAGRNIDTANAIYNGKDSL